LPIVDLFVLPHTRTQTHAHVRRHTHTCADTHITHKRKRFIKVHSRSLCTLYYLNNSCISGKVFIVFISQEITIPVPFFSF